MLMFWKWKVYLNFLHLVLERTLFVEYNLYNIKEITTYYPFSMLQ